jgi:hypothetical protein
MSRRKLRLEEYPSERCALTRRTASFGLQRNPARDPADRIGRRRVMLLSVTMMAITTLFIALRSAFNSSWPAGKLFICST